METFDKIIAIFVVCITLKVVYSISSKLFFKGKKITSVVKKVREIRKQKKG